MNIDKIVADSHLSLRQKEIAIANELYKALGMTDKIITEPRIIDLDKVSIDDIKKYIRSKHSILWQNWYVTDPKGLADAAKWVESLLNELYSGLSGIESGGN